MEVLLIQDVDNLGYAGDVKKVANGFGRNYLLPQKLAILATPGALNQAETIRNAGERRRAQERADAEAIVNQLKDLVLVFERRAGELGKLYGSVTSKDIAEKIITDTGITVDKRKISLAEPIRQLGMHTVTIKLVIDFNVDIKVEVLPEGGILERERLAAKKAAQEAAEAEAATQAEEEVQAEAETAPQDSAEEDATVEATETPANDATIPSAQTDVEETPTQAVGSGT